MLQISPSYAKRFSFRLLLSIALWSSGLIGGAFARAETATVRVDPEFGTVEVGETTDIEFIIQDVSDLYGIDIQVDYDALLLEVVDADAGRDGIQVTEGEFPYPDFVAENDADNSTGTIRYVVTQLNPRDPAEGSGVIMTVRFRGLDVGTSVLEIQRADLVTSSALQIDSQISWGELTVESSTGGVTTPSPTAVIVPTLAPTTQGGTATPSQPTATSASGGYPSAQTTNIPSSSQTTTSPISPQATTAPAVGYPGVPTPPIAPGAPTFTMVPRPAVTRATAPADEPSRPSALQGTVVPKATSAPSTPAGQGEIPMLASTSAPASAPTMLTAVAPTTPLTTEPPDANPTLARVEPLISQDLFVCMSVVLFLFTVALAFYLARHQNRRSS